MENVSEKVKGVYRPRAIDRVAFGILGATLMLSGAYVVGPWYLQSDSNEKAPLYHLFDGSQAVTLFGYAILISGLGLAFASAAKHATRFYTAITGTALLTGFLLRLYSLIGVFLTLDSWRPPSYLSHISTVVLLGAYWVWVKVSVRPTQ